MLSLSILFFPSSIRFACFASRWSHRFFGREQNNDNNWSPGATTGTAPEQWPQYLPSHEIHVPLVISMATYHSGKSKYHDLIHPPLNSPTLQRNCHHICPIILGGFQHLGQRHIVHVLEHSVGLGHSIICLLSNISVKPTYLLMKCLLKILLYFNNISCSWWCCSLDFCAPWFPTLNQCVCPFQLFLPPHSIVFYFSPWDEYAYWWNHLSCQIVPKKSTKRQQEQQGGSHLVRGWSLVIGGHLQNAHHFNLSAFHLPSKLLLVEKHSRLVLVCWVR